MEGHNVVLPKVFAPRRVLTIVVATIEERRIAVSKNALLNTVSTILAGTTLAAGLLFPTVGIAQEVTLRSTDGTINVNGELIDVQDGSYIIRTALGELRLATSRVSCEGEACPVFEDSTAGVAIVGSEAIGQRLMPILLRGYATSLDADAEISNPSEDEAVASLISEGGFGEEISSFSVASVGNADGFTALLEGDAQIGLSSRRILVDEARALRADGAESMVGAGQEQIVALDSVVVVVHESNPVDQLTVEQIADIYAGRIRNWSEVGGPDQDINVINYADDTTNFDFFMSYLYGENIPQLRVNALVDDDQEMANVVFLDEHAIGFMGFAFQRGTKNITLVNECGISMQPDSFTAKTEEYILSRRMYLYNRGDNLTPDARSFLDFVATDAANDAILKSGFIDLGIVSHAQDETDPRRVALDSFIQEDYSSFETQVAEDLIELMDGNDRLSVTIHFRPGSSVVDERGGESMRRLLDYLEDVPSGSTVTFVGFTDDQGVFSANETLSIERAELIKEQVIELAGSNVPDVNFAHAGFGQIAPVQCNTSERGREINRRVEVWITSES